MTDKTFEELLTLEKEVIRDDAVILHLAGEIDISSAHLLSRQFDSMVTEGRSAIILDATNVSFMDSTGLHALVEGKRTLHDTGARIFLVPSRQVRRVLELVFPDPVVAVRVNSVEEALAALDSAEPAED